MSGYNSSSTYCSEAERKLIEQKYLQMESIRKKQQIQKDKRPLDRSRKSERFFGYGKTQSSWSQPHPIREIYSPSILASAQFTPSELILPPSQNYNERPRKKSTSLRLLLQSQPLITKQFSHDLPHRTNSKQDFQPSNNCNGLMPYKNNFRKTYEANKIDWKNPKRTNHFAHSKNKIFESEYTIDPFASIRGISKSSPRNSSDTASITSEIVSRIVDREIALNRKKMHRKNSNRNCDVSQNISKLDYEYSSKFHPLRPIQSDKRHQSFFNSGHHRNEVHARKDESVKYKLTETHVKKLAKRFGIKKEKFRKEIENVLNENELIVDDSQDENSEINVSQELAKRRYSRKLFPNSDASK